MPGIYIVNKVDPRFRLRVDVEDITNDPLPEWKKLMLFKFKKELNATKRSPEDFEILSVVRIDTLDNEAFTQ